MRSRTVIAAVAAMLFCSAAIAGAQTVEEIVAKNIKSKGGVEALSSTTTLKITGTMTTQGMETQMTTWAKRPNLKRNEIDAMGQKIVQAFDGTTGWMAMGAMPPQPMPQNAALKQQAEFDSVFINYRELGRNIELVGKETLDGKETYHLKVTSKDGPVMDYYLDADTGLERKFVATVEGPGGMKQQVENRFDDFKTVDGRTMPHTIRTLANGNEVAVMKIQKVEFNIPIDDAMFKMPAKM
jgi:outer membrane lipoprotein-sorting protein